MWPSKFLAVLTALLVLFLLLSVVPARADPIPNGGDCTMQADGLVYTCGHTPQGDKGAFVATPAFFVYEGVTSGDNGGASAGAGSLAGFAVAERSARPTVVVAAYATTVVTFETIAFTQDAGDGYRAEIVQHHYGQPADRPSSDAWLWFHDGKPYAHGDLASGTVRFDASVERGPSASVLGIPLPLALPEALP